MHPHAAPGALGLGVLLLLVALPTGLAEEPGVLVADETFPAGEYRAYRVRLHERASFEWGGGYMVQSPDDVVPFLAYIQGPDGPFAWFASFDEPFEGGGTVRLGVSAHAGEVRHEVPAPERGLGVLTFLFSIPADPGDYDIVVVTAPANGEARALAFVFGGAHELIASEGGDSLLLRAGDASPVGARASLGVGPSHGFRGWASSGGDAATPVLGRLFGFFHTVSGLDAWQDPAGQPRTGVIMGGAPGAWTASFAPDAYPAPCAPQLPCGAGETEAFAFGADVRFG